MAQFVPYEPGPDPGLIAVTPGFAVMSGLVVWVVRMGLGWHQAAGRAGFNVPDCRFVPG
jgi:hypothetical protein